MTNKKLEEINKQTNYSTGLFEGLSLSHPINKSKAVEVIKNNGLPKKGLINHKIDFYGDFGVDLSCIILLSDDDILDNMCYDVKQNKGYTNDFKFIRINNAV